MTIIVAADHAGFTMKEHMKEHLEKQGRVVEDVGAHSFDADDDYPLFMRAAAERVAGSDAVGFMFGGSGQGEAIVANRVHGVRALVYAASNPDLVKVGREHNDANMLSFGARFLSREQVAVAVDLFLSVSFSGDARHVRRIAQIDE